MANFKPEIGVKGLYSVKEPFNTKLLTGVLYEPVSVRTISDLVSDGVDPFTEIYAPMSISQDDYVKDVAAGVLIVAFRADSGNIVRVPNTYITGQPDIGGVPYRTLMLAIQLAPIPDSLDLTVIQNQISDLVFDTLGVRSPVIPIVASPPTVLSQAEHDATEAARKHNIATTQTDYAKYLDMKKQRDDALTQLQLRDDYIVANLPPAPSP